MAKILCMDFGFTTIRKEVAAWAAKHDLGLEFCAPKTQEEYLKLFANNDVKIIVNTWPDARAFGGYTDDMIHKIAASGVKAIIHQGAGFDVVGDVHLWKQLGVTVSNCPQSPAPDTADTAIYLLLGAMRHLPKYEKSLREGKFRGNKSITPSIQGKKLGILGMGNIGRLIRDRALPFGFSQIYYHQRSRLAPELEKDSIFLPDVDEFLGTVDIVVLVAPHNKATHHIISRERMFNVMKDSATIVNVARGPLIDEAALVEALDSDKINGAGLDVFEYEPEVHPGLIKSDKTLLLPHIAAMTEYNLHNLEKEIFTFLQTYVEEGKVLNQVN